MTNAPLIPAPGTLERLLLDKMLEKPEGVTFLDFRGTGITANNIDAVANNLRSGMFVAENDNELKLDD